jgi:signal transduction histidine kinase
MDTHLLLHNIGYVFFDAIFVMLLAVFLLVKGKRDTATFGLIGLYVSVAIYAVSQAIGVSVADPELSRKILMFNLVDFFMPLFTAHAVFAFLGKEREQRPVIAAAYVIAFGLIAFFIANPLLFLEPSTPKLYFPNYYEPGQYYWVMLLFFFTYTAYFFVVMFRTYLSSNGIERNRIKYFFWALLLGWAFGSLNFPLVYDIPVDPLWGVFFMPIYAIPFTYAALRYELMDIKLAAQKAFIYTALVIATGLLISVMNLANEAIVRSVPGLPFWLIPLGLSIVTVAIGYYIWHKIKEAELLKYEFLAVISHKFRTPLTHIEWTAEELVKKPIPQEIQEDLLRIETSAKHLVDLTNLLESLSQSERMDSFDLKEIDLEDLITRVLAGSGKKATAKNIKIHYAAEKKSVVLADKDRLRFVLETLVGNAIAYTPEGGSITIATENKHGEIVLSVHDTGVGITEDELPLIFNKFYRGTEAKHVDTEGLGIGLYMAKLIVERHGGRMWVRSEGKGLGTTFFVSLKRKN